MRFLGLLTCCALVVSAALAACSGPASSGTGGMAPKACTVGVMVECTCTGSDRGTQTCVDGFQYGPCICGSGGSTSTGGAAPDGGDEAGGAEAGPPAGTPITLVQGLSGIQDFVVYTSHVYWTSADGSGIVAQCPVAGCEAPLVLGSSQAFPRSIAVTNGVVVWSVYQTVDDGGVDLGLIARATTGVVSSGKTYLAGQLQPDAVAADPNHVYWSVAGEIRQCDLFGCTTPIALGADTAQALATDASYVYWTNLAGRVFRVPIGGGGTPVALSAVDTPGVRGIALAGGQVLWATTTTILACSITGCVGDPVALATNQSIVALRHSIAADGTHAYWSSGSAVVRCPLSGCPSEGPEVVAAGQSEPTSIALDASQVYWVDGDAIKKLPKPK